LNALLAASCTVNFVFCFIVSHFGIRLFFRSFDFTLFTNARNQ